MMEKKHSFSTEKYTFMFRVIAQILQTCSNYNILYIFWIAFSWIRNLKNDEEHWHTVGKVFLSYMLLKILFEIKVIIVSFNQLKLVNVCF